MNSDSLALGFWVLCLASFKPNINFGFLSGVAILMALLADLVVLPAAITLLKPKFNAAARRCVADGGEEKSLC